MRAKNFIRPFGCCALSLMLVLVACSEEAAVTTATAPPVMVGRAQSHRIVDRIQATGQLLAKAEARVAAQGDGEITGVAADEGTAVEVGQIIIEIDPERRRLQVDDAQASLVQSEAQLAEARREAARIQQLHTRGAASKAQLDVAETEDRLAQSRVAASRARLGLAKRALRDASVTAPFAGLVARRYVNVGEYVNASQPLFDLVALDPVEVEFYLSEIDSSRVKVGQKVQVRVAPFPDEAFEARVSVVSPVIDPRTRTLRVKAILRNSDGRLRPGLFARVDLGVAEREGVVMISEEAVLQRSDGSVVFRFDGRDRVERLRVETGTHRGDLVEVRGGVKKGDWIVVRGQTGLMDGSAVDVREADGSPAPAAAVSAAIEGHDG